MRGARVVDPAQGLDGVQDLWLAEGRVAAVGRRPEGLVPDRVIEAAGWVACPGLVDLRAHLREPGQEHKGTIASETAAAAAGGITTLCTFADYDPVVDTPAVVDLIRHRAEAAGRCRVVVVGALTQGLDGERLSEMGALRAAGCPGVGNARRPLANPLVLRRAMEYAATHGLTVFLCPEDPHLRNRGCAHEGQVATRLGLPGVPEAAETAAVAQALALVQQTGVRAHLGPLSTARAVRMVARARYDGLPVTADVTAHHLHLTEMDLGEFDARCHVEPPLRTQRDRDGLRYGLVEGTLGAVCSDHQPHEPDAKLAPFPATAPGLSGVETLLSLTLRLVEEEVLSLAEAVARLTQGPAEILGLAAQGIGSLRPGAPADLCLFDPERRWTVRPEGLRSRGRHTPFAGWELPGVVMLTLLEGRVAYRHPEAGPALEGLPEGLAGQAPDGPQGTRREGG